MQNTQNSQFSSARLLMIKFYQIGSFFLKIFLCLSLISFINVVRAENPYQEALRLQRQLEEQQRQPVGPLGITRSQIQIQQNLEQESQIQQQKIQNLQTEINRLKQRRQRNDEDESQ